MSHINERFQHLQQLASSCITSVCGSEAEGGEEDSEAEEGRLPPIPDNWISPAGEVPNIIFSFDDDNRISPAGAIPNIILSFDDDNWISPAGAIPNIIYFFDAASTDRPG